MDIISLSKLTEYFNNINPDKPELNSKAKATEINLEVFYCGTSLYKFNSSTQKLEVSCPIEIRHDVIEVIDRAGIFTIQVEFHPATKMDRDISHVPRNLVLDLFGQTRTDSAFAKWFIDFCSLLGKEVFLLPDTNFIRRHYYSNVLKPVLLGKGNISFKIPRLVMLEIENKYNKAGKEAHDKKKKVQKISERNIQALMEEYGKGKEKRVSLHAINEILSLQKHQAEILPNLDLPLLESFSRAAGSGFADVWIRRKISEYANKQSALSTRNKNGKVITISKPGIIFMTCDIMNALAAAAEGLNTIYFSRMEEDSIVLEFDINKRLSNVLFNTAIHFRECICVIKYNNKIERLRLLGTWKGKGTYDWHWSYIMKIEE
jgi:hypothetical protein